MAQDRIRLPEKSKSSLVYSLIWASGKEILTIVLERGIVAPRRILNRLPILLEERRSRVLLAGLNRTFRDSCRILDSAANSLDNVDGAVLA